jgi:iron complex outermembrane recepter protein
MTLITFVLHLSGVVMRLNPIVRTLAVAFGGLAVLAQPAFAQQQTDGQKLERVEITGSRIKRVDTEGVAPVLVIRREEIEKSGASTVEDLIRKLPILNNGSFTDASQSGNSFAPSTSAASLRGLGANATLVLVNGRRVPNYGFAQNITDSFADLNAIPFAAIERIEVLKDGAAAIYGSDAIAGVINVILRKDYQGAEVSAFAGTSSQGGATEMRASGTFGFGSLAKDRFNVMISADAFKRETLLGADRSFANNANREDEGGFDFRSPTGSPGTWLTNPGARPALGLTDNTVFPSCPESSQFINADSYNTCGFNFAPFTSLLPGTERKSVVARGTYEFSPTLSIFADLRFSNNIANTASAPTPGGFNLPRGHNSFPSAAQLGLTSIPASVTSIGIRYRFLDIGPRLNEITSTTTNFTLGLKGSFGTWDYEAGFTKGQNKVESVGTNYISATALTSLVTDGRYSFVNPAANTPELVASLGLRATPVRKGLSELDAFDARASTELFAMGGGNAGIAFGVDWRKESLQDLPDPLSIAGLIVGSGGTQSAGGRTMKAGWMELSFPIIKGLETQVAVRHETYSNTESATVPKFAASYKPTNNILVRGGFSQGFRAPSLVEQYLGASTSFPQVRDVVRCEAYQTAFGTTDARSVAVCRSPQIQSTLNGNTDLKPEKSKNTFFGFAIDATPELNFGVDYYKVKHTNKIDVPLNGDILRNFTANVTRSDPGPNDILANTVGPLRGAGGDTTSGITRKPQNFSAQETSGFDFDVRYRLKTAGAGQFDMRWRSTYMQSFKRALSVSPELTDLDGTYDYPQWRTTLALDWTRGPWDTNVSFNHVSGYDQFYQAVFDRVSDETTVDAQVQYNGIRNLKLQLGVRNLMNKRPVFSDEDFQGFNTSQSSPVGRFVYLKATYAFK